jgi:hypothetical protein
MTNMLSVYLFTQSTDIAPPLMQRRENALVALREELLQLGDLRVSPSPNDADLQVEILNLLGTDEGPIGRAVAERSADDAERRRILIVRVSSDTDRFDFVCSDGSASAERQAARRIHASMDPTLGARVFAPMVTSSC